MNLTSLIPSPTLVSNHTYANLVGQVASAATDGTTVYHLTCPDPSIDSTCNVGPTSMTIKKVHIGTTGGSARYYGRLHGFTTIGYDFNIDDSVLQHTFMDADGLTQVGRRALHTDDFVEATITSGVDLLQPVTTTSAGFPFQSGSWSEYVEFTKLLMPAPAVSLTEGVVLRGARPDGEGNKSWISLACLGTSTDCLGGYSYLSVNAIGPSYTIYQTSPPASDVTSFSPSAVSWWPSEDSSEGVRYTVEKCNDLGKGQQTGSAEPKDFAIVAMKTQSNSPNTNIVSPPKTAF